MSRLERSRARVRRGRAWFDGFSLDLKLGGRMLVKYPGLTIVGGLAMAFAICVGTVIFQVLALFFSPTLPLPAGNRIVQIRNWDVAANDPEPRALHDFIIWRDARVPVEVAEITASGFRIAQGEPLDARRLRATVLFALGLTVLGSAIAGVVPALKVTRGMGSRLKQAAAGAGGLQFGGVWTAVIVVQVAITVAFPAIVYVVQWEMRHIQTFDVGFADEEFLAVRIEMDAPAVPAANADSPRRAQNASFAPIVEELRRRVAAEPTVAGVTFVDRLPRTDRPEVEIELGNDATVTAQSARGASADPRLPLRVVTLAGIEPSYFEVLEAPMLAGRAFRAADLGPAKAVAIVDQGFVDQVLQGRNPIGQQVRFVDDGRNAPPANSNPWFEVVGVVKELGIGTPMRKGRAAGFYLPATPDLFDEVYMMVHVRADPMTLGPQLREIAAAVNPTLRLSEFQRVDEVTKGILWVVKLWLRVSIVMTAVALVLSLAGIYAVLSFIVARRTREIGVRVALGASRPRVVAAIFRRPLIQVGLGILTGAVLIAAGGSVETEMPGLSAGFSLKDVAMLVAYATLMLGVCLLACVVPTRRALGVEPTTALRMD